MSSRRNQWTLLENEFKEAGTIGDKKKTVDPRDSDDEEGKETPVEKSGTLDKTTVVIEPYVKYLKSLDPSHVKEFVSVCRSLRASEHYPEIPSI